MPSINSINYCPNCGSKTIVNANFCMECGYELKILKQIITKHEKLDNSFENCTDTVENTITEESKNYLEDYKSTRNYTEQSTDQTIKEEQNDDFEIVRPDTEEINNTKTNEEKALNEDENNNFNLVRPNSQNVSAKKNKVKKNFSILNQKK